MSTLRSFAQLSNLTFVPTNSCFICNHSRYLSAITHDISVQSSHFHETEMGFKVQVPPGSPFTIHNIPFGVISTKANKTPRCATVIGNHVIDLVLYSQHGRLDHISLRPAPEEIFSQVTSNPLLVKLTSKMISHFTIC
jgi:hypothetical protein